MSVYLWQMKLIDKSAVTIHAKHLQFLTTKS